MNKSSTLLRSNSSSCSSNHVRANLTLIKTCHKRNGFWTIATVHFSTDWYCSTKASRKCEQTYVYTLWLTIDKFDFDLLTVNISSKLYTLVSFGESSRSIISMRILPPGKSAMIRPVQVCCNRWFRCNNRRGSISLSRNIWYCCVVWAAISNAFYIWFLFVVQSYNEQ